MAYNRIVNESRPDSVIHPAFRHWNPSYPLCSPGPLWKSTKSQLQRLVSRAARTPTQCWGIVCQNNPIQSCSANWTVVHRDPGSARRSGKWNYFVNCWSSTLAKIWQWYIRVCFQLLPNHIHLLETKDTWFVFHFFSVHSLTLPPVRWLRNLGFLGTMGTLGSYVRWIPVTWLQEHQGSRKSRNFPILLFSVSIFKGNAAFLDLKQYSCAWICR